MRCDELGLGKYGTDSNPPTVQKQKGKDKVVSDDEYVLESEHESNDSSKEMKRIPAGPRTRSRANAATTMNTEIKTSSAPKILNPTCRKLLKQCGNIASGSVVAYIALRERQKQNIEADPRIEDVGESSLQNPLEIVEKGPKKPRGRTKMLKVHGRSPTEKPVITLSKNGQPIGDRKVRSELSNFLGTLVKQHVSLTHVNWHVVPQDLKKKMLKYTLDRYNIPAHGEKYINKTLNSLWRVHKSRVKKDHYTKYDSDEKRIENRPHDIPLEDFKNLLKYWADEGVQSLAEDNAARRNSYADPHTLGRKTLAEVKEKLTPIWPPHHELESISKVVNTKKGASTRQIGMQSKKELEKETIDEVLREGGDADAVLPDGKHGPYWLVGRQGSLLALENTPAIPQPSADELTAKITRDLESQMEAKVNRKVQENMTWFLKKLGEANPTLKFDIGDFCATFSSDQDECDTPITQTPWGATS
ncbi:hypothetical protein OROMI_018674 [Orobanche minor]